MSYVSCNLFHMRAAIYTRISKDTEGTELGVTRQQDDCRREAERRGWNVADVYTDNDVSATRSKVRPEYQRMLRDIRSGHIQAVVVWSIDRLTRTPRELEDIIDLADRHGLALANVGGNTDLSTPEGRVFARNLGAFARYETDNLSKRLRRKFEQKAIAGEPHGYSPYGHQRVDGKDVPVEHQAAIIRECAQRVLDRESLRSIVTDLNDRGEPGPKAPRWNTTILRQILLRPSNAGLRQHRGQIVGKATTEAILDPSTFDQLTALLTDPSRRDNHAGPTHKYLLSGIALCGRCGGRMRRTVGRQTTVQGVTKRQPPAYQCAECFRVRRQQEAVDQLVEAVVVRRLTEPDAVDLFAQGDTDAVDECRRELTAIDAKLDVTADQFAADQITAAQLKRITAQLRARRESAEARLQAAKPRTILTDVAGEHAAEKWAALPVAAKREALEMLATVTIHPSGPGRSFDPDLIEIHWLSEAP